MGACEHVAVKELEGAKDATLSIRRARLLDVAEVRGLIAPAIAKAEILPVSEAALARLFAQGDAQWQFFVASQGGRLAACGGVRAWTPSDSEIRTVCVGEHLRGVGVGTNFVTFLEAWAALQGALRLFALTKRPNFFVRSGYAIVERTQFPWKIAGDCLACARYPDCGEVAVVKEFV